MLIEKADMLDVLFDNFVECVVSGYVTGWLDAIGTLVDADEKKQGKMDGECGE